MPEALGSLFALAALTGLSTLGVAAVALLRPAIGRWAGAEARYALWLLVPVLLAAVALARALPQPPVSWQLPLPAGEWPAAPLPGAPSQSEVGHAWAADGRRPPNAVLAVLATWALGATALGWGLAAQHRRFARRSLPPGASAVLQGAWRPRVRLPADFRQRFAAPERRLVLLHERVHAERGDTRWTALALALLVLQWFNPVAWWAMRRLRQDMELAADAAVLRRRPQALPAYRAALLRAQNLGPTPLSVSPCATHPLIERIAMLPAHLQRPRRQGWVALLLASVAGVALAVQPQPAPPVPQPPVAALAPSPAAVPALPASPPAAVKAAPPATPTVLAVDAPTAPPAPPAPPLANGYTKLRLDLSVIQNGRRFPLDLALQTFGERTSFRFTSADGSDVRVTIGGRPYAGDAVKGEDLILLELAVTDAASGRVISQPRLVTKDGMQATIEMGEEGGNMLRIEVLPRFVQTREHGSIAALAELTREIEAGHAPAHHFKP